MSSIFRYRRGPCNVLNPLVSYKGYRISLMYPSLLLNTSYCARRVEEYLSICTGVEVVVNVAR